MLTRTVEESLDRMPELEEGGTKVARAVHQAVLRGGEGTRRIADVLHGTWLGHPLHAVLTDFTIGSWAAGAVFDAIAAFRDSPAARQAGDTLAALGTASAVPTAASGLMDYSTLPHRDAAAPATLHGAMNAAIVGLYLASVKNRRDGNRGRGLFFSTTALALAGASAWLGGHLVYKNHVGVDHSESFDGPKEWTPVLDAYQLREREPKRVEVDGKAVLLYRDGGEIYAIGAVCSHAGGPLEEGQVRDGCVQCPWHDSVFDLRDGSIRHGPATQPQPDLAARERDGRIEIRLEQP